MSEPETEYIVVDEGDHFELEVEPNDGPALSSAALAILARRELAIRATDAISEVLEVDVTVPALLRLADAQENETVRLAAVRALRCIESIARDDSAVVRAIGETGIYHYVEGVIEFGASEAKYLELLREHGLSAEGVTGLYALREAVADETNGHRPSFRSLCEALASIGLSPGQAAYDVEDTVRSFSEAGFFIDYAGSKTYDRPIFSPTIAAHREFSTDIDTRRFLDSDTLKVPFSGEFPEETED